MSRMLDEEMEVDGESPEETTNTTSHNTQEPTEDRKDGNETDEFKAGTISVVSSSDNKDIGEQLKEGEDTGNVEKRAGEVEEVASTEDTEETADNKEATSLGNTEETVGIGNRDWEDECFKEVDKTTKCGMSPELMGSPGVNTKEKKGRLCPGHERALPIQQTVLELDVKEEGMEILYEQPQF